MRNRLIELIASKVCEDYSPLCDEYVPHSCEKCYANSCRIGAIADEILEDGWVRLPCKVGDVVYSPRENSILEQNVISIEIEKDPHVRVYFTCDYLCDGCPNKRTYQNQDGDSGCWGEYGESFFAFEDFGKTVFLTREEAEQALKGEHHAEIH